MNLRQQITILGGALSPKIVAQVLRGGASGPRFSACPICAGGPGSGCNPAVGVCGRPSGSRLANGIPLKYNAAQKTWVTFNGKDLPGHLKGTRIPPAWKDVRCSADPKEKVLVVGHDVKGREQAVYSAEFKQQQADAKFARIEELDKKFDTIKKQVAEDVKNPDTKEEASTLRLIMATGIRPGGEGDTGADKKAYGATTLLGRHVKGDDESNVRLKFVGKKGVDLSIPVRDLEVARDLLQRREAAGSKGEIFQASAASLSAYTHSQDGGGFKTKDFRTLLGTRTAQAEVAKVKRAPSNEKAYKKAVNAVGDKVAKTLGNTRTVALQSYIHPVVFAKWKVAA